jgi:hypothetical protein
MGWFNCRELLGLLGLYVNFCVRGVVFGNMKGATARSQGKWWSISYTWVLVLMATWRLSFMSRRLEMELLQD